MSAPILACSIADAIGALLKPMCESLGAKATVQWFPESPSCHSFFNVSIHDGGQCFSGMHETDAGLALLRANSDRQAFLEAAASPEQVVA